jgi:hypothetical protein
MDSDHAGGRGTRVGLLMSMGAQRLLLAASPGGDSRTHTMALLVIALVVLAVKAHAAHVPACPTVGVTYEASISLCRLSFG